MELLIQILVMGIVATFVLDVWAIFLNKAFNLPITNWAMVGRWVGHLPTGKFIHNTISDSESIKDELILGWVFHYFIGIAYAAIYLFLVIYAFGIQPTLYSASLFGLVTVLAPWLVLQPGLGLGMCAGKMPNPRQTRTLNLIAHTIFGSALFIGWISVPGYTL